MAVISIDLDFTLGLRTLIGQVDRWEIKWYVERIRLLRNEDEGFPYT